MSQRVHGPACDRNNHQFLTWRWIKRSRLEANGPGVGFHGIDDNVPRSRAATRTATRGWGPKSPPGHFGSTPAQLLCLCGTSELGYMGRSLGIMARSPSLPNSRAARWIAALLSAYAFIVAFFSLRLLCASHPRVSLPEPGANSNATPAPTAAPTNAAVMIPVPLLGFCSFMIPSLSLDEVDIDLETLRGLAPGLFRKRAATRRVSEPGNASSRRSRREASLRARTGAF